MDKSRGLFQGSAPTVYNNEASIPTAYNKEGTVPIGSNSGGTDFTQTQFFPSLEVIQGEFLSALPRVLASKVQADFDAYGNTHNLYVATQTNAGMGFEKENPPIIEPTPGFSVPVVNAQFNPTPNKFILTRMGYEVPALLLDKKLLPASASANPEETRLRVATTNLLAYLNILVSKGGKEPYGDTFMGLGPLCDHFNQHENPGMDADLAAMALMSIVRPRGNGLGAGLDAFVGNNEMLAALILSPTTGAGREGQSGWKVDRRTGRNVYHFMGIPFYRAEVDIEDGAVSGTGKSTLYGVNFGPDGLRLVHGYGTAETVGIQVDRQPVQAANAVGSYLVQGAWTLMVGDPQAIFAIEGIPVFKPTDD